MNLSTLVIRNIKRNFKKYAMYFFSLSFSVFTAYSFFALIENDTVSMALTHDRYKSMLIGFAIIIMVFVMFFLISSNNSFIRARKKEVSTYSLFGMTNRRIGKMLFAETMIVGIAALIIGIAAGMFFSKLTAMILLDMALVNFKGEIAFSIAIKAIFITAFIFVPIFCVMGLSGLRVINKFELVELFKAEKISDGKVKGSALSLILSIALISCGYFLSVNANPLIIVKASISILCLVIGGTYLFFRGGLPKVMDLLRRNKNSYYKGANLISTSVFIHRIKSIAGTMATIAVLSAVATTAIASGYTLYSNIEKNTYDVVGYDLYYYSRHDHLINEVNAAFEKHNVKIIDQFTTQRYTCTPKMDKIVRSNNLIYMSPEDGYYFRVYSQSIYNKLISVSGSQFESADIERNEVMFVDSYYSSMRQAIKGTKLIFSDRALKITSCASSTNVSFGAPFTIVINDNDFDALIKSKDIKDTDAKGRLYDKAYVFKYQNPLSSKELNSELVRILEGNTGSYRTAYNHYIEYMETYGLVCFIGYFMSFVFILMTASMLYFKQIMAAHEERNQYKTLRKIGMDDFIEKRVITKRLLPVFMIPLAVGIVHSIFAMKTADTLVFSYMIPLDNSYFAVLASSAVMYGVYAVVYGIFYFITKGQYSRLIKSEII